MQTAKYWSGRFHLQSQAALKKSEHITVNDALLTVCLHTDTCTPQTVPGRWMELSFDVTMHAQTKKIIGNSLGDLSRREFHVLSQPNEM